MIWEVAAASRGSDLMAIMVRFAMKLRSNTQHLMFSLWGDAEDREQFLRTDPRNIRCLNLSSVK